MPTDDTLIDEERRQPTLPPEPPPYVVEPVDMTEFTLLEQAHALAGIPPPTLPEE